MFSLNVKLDTFSNALIAVTIARVLFIALPPSSTFLCLLVETSLCSNFPATASSLLVTVSQPRTPSIIVLTSPIPANIAP